MKNEKKQDILIDAISRIDEDIIDQNLKKRFKLLDKKLISKRALISAVSIAACFCIVLTSIFIPRLFNKDPSIDSIYDPIYDPIDDPNVPVYEGMTVENNAPVVDTAHNDTKLSTHLSSRSNMGAASANSTLSLSKTPGSFFTCLNSLATATIDANTSNDSNDESNEDMPIFGETYYALPGEDIYIHIHLTNPADYEILSFTLNGIKYSSYMFEAGSDMENLILKLNVGDARGLQQYTIDAIKYINGDQIKDVKMKGDRTVDVIINGNQGALSIIAEVEFDTIRFSTEWAEDFAGSHEITALAIYEDDTLYKELSVNDRTVSSLPLGKRFLLKAKYIDEGTEKTVVHVFETPKASEGFLVANGEIIGLGTCQDSILYIDMPISYLCGMHEGTHIKEVYISSNVTKLGDGEFLNGFNFPSLEKVVISEGLTELQYLPPNQNLKNITIPVSVTSIGGYLGSEILIHHQDKTRHLDIWYNGTTEQWSMIEIDPVWFVTGTVTVHCIDSDINYTSTWDPWDALG